MVECEFFQSKIGYLGHKVSAKGISFMKQNVKAITALVPTTNMIEARHIIGLIGFTGNSFLYLVM